MRHRQRILFEHTADFADISKRTAHADKLGVRQNIFEPFKLFKLFCDVFFYHIRFLNGSKPLLLDHIRKHYRAKRQSDRVENVLSVVIDKLGASSADIHYDAPGYIH